MVIALLASLAHASPVVCEPLRAAQIIHEAKLDERRVPATQPNLVPGLALASDRTEPALRAELRALCAEDPDLSLAVTETWTQAAWTAWSLVLTRTTIEGCVQYQERIVISVAVDGESAPEYRLRNKLPVDHSPIGNCPSDPVWREEHTIAGEDGPVRLLITEDHEGDRVRHRTLVARHATREGWYDQRLEDPASPRLVDPDGDGALWTLTEADDTPWIVRHGERRTEQGTCQPVPGQTLYRWDHDHFVAVDGAEARTQLALQGKWRLMGDDGWLLIVAQDDVEDEALIRARQQRLQRRSPMPLYLLPSERFPMLNAGFLVVAPAPFATEAEAKAAAGLWGRRPGAYVKQAWAATEACGTSR